MTARYIIHGTMLDNLANILATGKLETHPHQILTQILFKDLPHQERQLSHWFMCGIILDKRILKARRWYATPAGGFYPKFEDAFNAKPKPDSHSHHPILAKNPRANPRAARIPSLALLKKHITARMAANTLGETGFIHSHEVLFDQDIPLAEWGVAIVVREWAFRNMISKAEQARIITKCQELGLSLVMYGGSQRSRYWTIGLNKMIDMIDEHVKTK